MSIGTRSSDVGKARPKRGVPWGRVVNPLSHSGRRSWILLNLYLTLVIDILLKLYIRHFDLFPDFGNGWAQVCGLRSHCNPRYLAGVFGSSDGIPVFGLAKVTGLQVGGPIVTSARWERQKCLIGCWRHPIICGLVEEKTMML